MSNLFKRLIGMLSVTEKNGFITITGLDTARVSKDITKLWSTSRVNAHMFTKFNRGELRFESFFAIEVRYILEQLIETSKRSANTRALARIVELLNENTWLRRIDKPHQSILNRKALERFTVKPLEAQYDFLNTYDRLVPALGLRGYMLASPAGTGKTLSSLFLAACIEADAVIVISPNNALRRVWSATFDSRFKTKPSYWVSDQGGVPDRAYDYSVFHYEALDSAIVYAQYLVAKTNKRVFVILDECHNFNNEESLRTQKFIELCKVANPVGLVWMSGTPIKALGSECVPFLRTVDPLFTDVTAAAMYKIFGKSAARANDILAHRIGHVSFKVEKATVVANVSDTVDYKLSFKGAERFTLDAIRDEIVQFIIERTAYYKANKAEYRAIYDQGIEEHRKRIGSNPQAQRDFLKYQSYIRTIIGGFDPVAHKELAKFCNLYEKKEIIPYLPKGLKQSFTEARSVVKYVHLKIRGEALGRVLGRRRIECFVEMAKHAELSEYIDNSEKKTVIFTSYVEVLEQLQKETSEDGYNPLVVYGATNKNLGSIIQRFERDPDINPLIATFDSLSTAVPLIMANTAIMFNQPFRQHEIEQASARIDRLDQDSPVHFVNVLLDTNGVPNISTRNLDIVEWSRQQVDQIMGNSSGLDNVSVESLATNYSIDRLDKFMDTHGLTYEAVEVSFEAVRPLAVIEPTTSFYYF